MKNKILGGIIMEENNNKEELNEVLESETAENTIKISYLFPPLSFVNYCSLFSSTSCVFSFSSSSGV